MSETEKAADAIAGAIADDEAIDWQAVTAEGEGDPRSDAELLDQLKVIDSIVSANRRRVAEATPFWLRLAGWAYTGLLAIAGLKVLLAIAGVIAFTAARGFDRPPLLVITFALFAGAGALLTFGGTMDTRSRTLGALFILIAATFADPFMPGSGSFAGRAIGVLHNMPVDAFLAVALWQFVARFPTEARPGSERRLHYVFVTAASLVGILLFAGAGLRAAGVFAQHETLQTALALIDRNAPARAYWPLLFMSAGSALPYLLWRAHALPVEERQRVALFVLALAGGITPFLIAVIASPFVPALARPPYRESVGLLLYVALWSIVPMTAYAVMVRRVIDVRFIIRRTTQHAAARFVVWTASIGPLAYLAFQGYVHRDLPLTELFTRHPFIELVGVAAAGFGVLTFRHQLLLAVDRWFLREPIDLGDVLARLERGFRYARSTHEFAAVLHREIEHALHPAALVIALSNDTASAFVPVSGDGPPLRVQSRLGDLLRTAPAVLHFEDGDAASSVASLPADEQDWLASGRFQLLAPLRPSTGSLVGLIAVGPSRSGLPWTKRQRVVLATLSSHFGARLENLLVRHGSAAGEPGRIQWASEVDWNSEPGACCETCGRMWPAQTRQCACGGVTTTAALPFLVAGKFRVERLIGRGATSVVYRAVDIALGRAVAIKTLTRLRPDRAERLQREARAMASVPHPNLALVFGVETWRGTPLLIVEYLPNGTLADRLRDGPLTLLETIDLGIFLADALDCVHASGLLHRDIKPSNIGFAHDDVPKLLDFGLVAVLDQPLADEEMPRAMEESGELQPLDSGMIGAAAIGGYVRGTPLYLSPEAVAGAQPQPNFDLWSLTMTLYESLTGRHPLEGQSVERVLDSLRRFRAPDVRTLGAACPESVSTFFARGLSQVVARRPATAAELRSQLRRLRGESL